MQNEDATARQPRRPGRRAAQIAAGLAVIVAAVWFAGGVLLEQRITHWKNNISQQNIEAVLPPAGGWLDGFPVTAARRYANIRLTGPGWRLTADHAAISVSLLRPDQLNVRFDGATLTAADDSRRGAATTAQLTIGLTPQGRLGAATLENVGWDGGNGQQWRAERLVGDWRLPDSPPVDHQQPGLTVKLTASGVAPPPPLAGLLTAGGAVGEGAATVTVMGALPALNPAGLEAWRADGGVIELNSLKANYAPLQLDGDGTLALDRDLQLIGAGAVRIAGADAAFAHAASRNDGPFKPKEIKQARQMAALLTQPDPTGGPPRLTLPLTVQDQRLFLGPFAVAKIPEIRW